MAKQSADMAKKETAVFFMCVKLMMANFLGSE